MVANNNADEKKDQGTSIIILNRNGSYMLNCLLSSFLKYNTHSPVEIIIIDHASIDNTAGVIAHYANYSFIYYIERDRNYSFSESCNYAAKKAVYPNLLFLHNDVTFNADVLPGALENLANQEIGVVGIGIEADINSRQAEGAEVFQHGGITFQWDEKDSRFTPITVEHEEEANAENYTGRFCHAVSSAFLLCRRKDFEILGGFSELYNYGYEDIDFCLKMKDLLNKKTFCSNNLTIKHTGGHTMAMVDPAVREYQHANNLKTFYSRCSGLINNLMLTRSIEPAKTGIDDNSFPYLQQHEPDIPVVVVAYNRPGSLQRLLNSIQKASYEQRVDLIISIDYSADNQKVLEVAKSFQWAYGKKEIINHKEHLGLRKHILKSADIAMDHDGIILLEDDLFVSPYYYKYIKDAYTFYMQEHNVAGVSLYTHSFNETAMLPFRPLDDDYDVFFMQVASSWGQFWSRENWSSFKRWYRNNYEKQKKHLDKLPADVKNWPESSWKKVFFQYLVAHNKYIVYPRRSLATNFGDTGMHMINNQVFQVPLSYRSKEFNFAAFKKSWAKYDAYCEILPESIKHHNKLLNDYSFTVDLYGIKPSRVLGAKYVLTSKKCSEQLYSFAKSMLPMELNIINNIKGNDFHLVLAENCEATNEYSSMKHDLINIESLLYHYNIYYDTLLETAKKINSREKH